MATERIIALIAGESGTGKSFFVANLRKALIYDTDIGGGLAYADARIARNSSERVQVGSYTEILNDLKRRQSNRSLSNVVTLAIDHLSAMHQEACLRHNPRDERDFGSSSEKATREWRRIREFARTQDFNLIVTSHQKPKWENEKAVGLVADAGKNVESDVSIALQIRRSNSYPSVAWVQKWRRDPEDQRGLIPNTFSFTIEAFEKLAGVGLLAPREPVIVATLEQVTELNSLIEEAKTSAEDVNIWLKKVGATSLEDAAQVSVEKFINYLKTKLKKAG